MLNIFNRDDAGTRSYLTCKSLYVIAIREIFSLKCKNSTGVKKAVSFNIVIQWCFENDVVTLPWNYKN